MSWDRQHLNAGFKPKRGFKTYREARDFAESLPGGLTPNAYKCDTCGEFHVGNKEKYQLLRRAQTVDNTLAGKLVHALRLVLDKGGQR